MSLRKSPRALTSRRAVLGAGGAGLLAATATGCGFFSTNPDASGGKGGHSRHQKKGKEAPMLASGVKKGQLPALAKRVPKDPLVLETTDTIGAYGGAWHYWYAGPSATYTIGGSIYYENLVRWNVPWTKVVPNIAKSWNITGGGKSYTFQLREGMKWSDGHPFTADDLVFAYDDVLMNTAIYPVPSSIFTVQEEPGSLEKIDDHAVRFTFHKPNGLFLENLATSGGNALFIPLHYMKQFHPKYNKAAKQEAKKQKFDSWMDWFKDRNSPMTNKDRPALDGWIVTTIPGKGSRVTYERNPYYWKTDKEGSQLPYLDHVYFPMISNLDTVVLRTVHGDVDLNFPRAAATACTPENKPVLARSRDQGNYHFAPAATSLDNYTVIAFNLTAKDEVLREVFRKKDFRIAMSYGINRPELIKSVYQRQGTPWQAAPAKGSGAYNERLATQYTEFDVAKANKHLDAAGLARNKSGERLGPDGKPIVFSIDVVTEKPDQINAMQLIQTYWKKLGIAIRIKTMDRNLFYTRKEANLHEANVWTGAGGLKAGIYFGARWYLPISTEANYAIPWAQWYISRGEDGEEPPAAAREQLALYDQIETTLDNKKKHQLFMRILDMAADQFWVIGTVMPGGVYATVRNDFKNVPKLIGGWYYANEGPSCPQQFYRGKT